MLLGVAIVVLLAPAPGIAAARDAPLRVAAALTLSGPAANVGAEVLEGIRIAIQEAGPQAPRIDLAVTDDGGSIDGAREAARRIAASDAAVVIGPALSAVAQAVDPIYAEAGLAVLSPNIATDETTGTFRLNLGQSRVGEALAEYLHHVLGGRQAALIHGDDGLGRPLALGFRRAAEQLGIATTYHPVSDAEQILAAARRVAGDLRRPAVVLGLLDAAAVPALRLLRRADVPGPFLGTTTYAYTGFARRFAAEQEERATPGFFTDGLYAASPVLFDSGSAALLAFAERFRARRGHEPSWRVVLGYDAMRLILDLLASALRDAPPDTAARRRAMLEALAALNDPARARIGLSGPTWFDGTRGRPAAIRFARFERGLLESAPLQLVPVTNPDLAEILAGAVVPVAGGRFARFQRVVYAGMYLNEIPRLDLPQASFIADFYLWLRSAGGAARPGEPDPADIQFPDMIRGEFDPARPAVRRELPDGSVYRLWRVRGEFRTDYDLRRFPFDRQTLALRLFNARAASDRIVYALDRRAMLGDQPTAPAGATPPASPRGAAASVAASTVAGGFPAASPEAFLDLTQWQPLRAEARRDVLVTPSALGDPLLVGGERVRELSGFRFEVELRRRTGATLAKSLLPLVLMTLMMFASLWYPHVLVRDKVAVALASALSGAVLLAAINSQLGSVGYTMAVEYAFYVFFALALLCTISVLLEERLRAAGRARDALRTERATRVVFVLVLAVTVAAGWLAATR